MEKQREDRENTKKNGKGSDGILFVSIVILIAAFVCQRIIKDYFDNDFFHIATSGRWILKHGIMRENVFFVKEGYATIIQQWLYAVLLYLSWQTGSYGGVLLFTVLQAVLLGVIAIAYQRIRGLDRRVALIGVLLFVLSVTDLNCRPEIASLCLFTAQLCCMERYRKNGKAGILYVLPVLMIVEINLHAAYAMFHFVLLLPYLVPVHRMPMARELAEQCMIRTEEPERKDFVLPVLLMGAVMFCNPYGVDAVTILLKSGNIRLLNISELRPVTIKEDSFALPVIGVLLLAPALYRKKLREATVLMFAGCLLLGLIALKNMLFFSLVLLMLWGDLFTELDCGRFWEWIAKVKREYARAAFGGALVLSMALVLYHTAVRITVEGGMLRVSNGLLPNLSDQEIYPAEAIRYLLEHESNPEKLRVMTAFNNGSSFLWNGIGHVYIEPKTEPYLRAVNGQSDIVSEYTLICTDASSAEIADFLARYDFDYICCSYYMQGLQVYLEQTDAYECVLASPTLERSVEKETGVARPVYCLYRRMP